MRDPINLKQVEYNGERVNILKIENMPEFDIEDYDFFDPKDMNKFISDVERGVRTSFEYRNFINFVRENMDMNKCSFYENVNNIDTFKISIELHHEPFSLYDMCVIVYNKRVFYRECLDLEAVCKEVMYLHYCVLVGLIPLSVTVHELVHNNYLFVPSDKVFGNYREFRNMYEPFMTPENKDILDRIEEYTRLYNEENSNNFILKKSYIYTDTSGAYTFPSYESIIGMLNSRIKQIKEGTHNANKPAKAVEFISK